MKLSGCVVAITGGGSGLGADACRLAVGRGASVVAVIDRDREAAEKVAAEIGGRALTADVTDEEQVRAVIDSLGGVDIWVHNAGIGDKGSTFRENEMWYRMWEVHVMAIVYATRALLPRWLRRGSGHFAAVASSNALTSNPVSASYAATKHAELALVEWLQFTYASRGVTASCFCPKGMLTPLLLAAADSDKYAASAVRTAVSSPDAARMLLDNIESGSFLATTYAPVLEEYELRARDPDAYLRLMQSVHDDLVPHVGAVPEPTPRS